MNKKKKSKLDFFTTITPESRDRFILQTQEFLQREYDIEVGNFDIEEIIEFALEEFGSAIYNQGSDNMKEFIRARFNDSLDDSYTLGID